MMRTNIALLWAFSTTAVGAGGQVGLKGNEVVECKIEKMSGSMDSFMPPELGDLIRFDLGKKELKLEFRSKTQPMSYIPTVVPLLRQKSTVAWKSHQAFYRAEKPDTISKGAVQLIIGVYGKVSDPIKKRPWSALIQKLYRPENARWTMEQVELSCKLL